MVRLTVLLGTAIFASMLMAENRPHTAAAGGGLGLAASPLWEDVSLIFASPAEASSDTPIIMPEQTPYQPRSFQLKTVVTAADAP